MLAACPPSHWRPPSKDTLSISCNVLRSFGRLALNSHLEVLNSLTRPVLQVLSCELTHTVQNPLSGVHASLIHCLLANMLSVDVYAVNYVVVRRVSRSAGSTLR